MQKFQLIKDDNGHDAIEVPLRGRALLSHPMYNKGTVFTAEERRQFELDGLLPERTASESVQARRTYEAIVRKTDKIEQYIGLAGLQDRNEVLFYKLLHKHLEEFLPIIYTPTVGEACKRYSHIFRRGRGIWIHPCHKGRIDEVLGNAPYEDVRLIVVTDNERILGLGDLGAGGMGIPIGKLALYSVAAGIHPSQTLPICLDVGTDNEELLNDELYVGWPHKRLRGREYDELVEEFVTAVQRRFPRALVQWEDFKKSNAFRLLDRYRDRLLSFNDDIEGTAAVTLAGVMGACRVIDKPLKEQRTVILGAGAAGIGIARQLREALRQAGLDNEALRETIVLLDSHGMLMAGTDLDEHKRDFAWTREQIEAAGIDPDGKRDLEEVTQALKPSVLIGTSGQPGIFTETVIRTMAEATERPIVLPISNPTANAEATPEDIIAWTDGGAVIATGSPFDPVEYRGRTYPIAQGNNVYIFPGVGLGALAAEARRLDDESFAVAARALASYLSDDYVKKGLVYPPLKELRRISAEIAFAVATEAVESGKAPGASNTELRKRIGEMMWIPEYPRLIPI
ncbi:MAG TPA: NAD-dependent malic enzyme [Gammaproteobacteria bacterium]|nr:NAD-dependent malic enzyme [Gammaproteobacteria bacterium]